jgi:Protein of unknown function (DUF2946)
MDDIVKAALQKWPNVPAVYGWLALDARGDWYLRDELVQAAGRFPEVKGSRIEHDKLKEFIHRNYEVDERGCWFFQNGPQRVYIELEAAPFIWRLSEGAGGEPQVQSHSGFSARVSGSWLDQAGRLFLQTERGLGLVHTLDMETASQAVEAGHWSPAEVRFEELPGRFAYVLSPQDLTGG